MDAIVAGHGLQVLCLSFGYRCPSPLTLRLPLDEAKEFSFLGIGVLLLGIHLRRDEVDVPDQSAEY